MPQTQTTPKNLPPMKLDDLIQTIVDKINSGEITRTDDLQDAKNFGDDILTTRGILYYTEERWNEGRWMSKLRTRQILRDTKPTETKTETETKTN